jgi:hypothetical protein
MDKWQRLKLKEKKYLYHATYQEYLPSIKEHGLGGKIIRRNFDIDDENKFVYLSSNMVVATEIAEISETIENDDSLEYLLNQIIVLKIEMDKIDLEKISFDETIDSDFLEEEYDETDQDFPLNQFPYFQYEGVIPFESVVQVIPRKDVFYKSEV